MKEVKGNSNVAALIGVGILGLIVGLFAGPMFMDKHEGSMVMKEDGSMIAIDTPAADLRVALNALLREHVDIGLETLRAAYDGSPAFDGAFAALDENSIAIAGAVGSVYGDEAEEQFLELWRVHIGFFADYTVGLKTNDVAKQNQAIDDLKGYGQSAGVFFSTANPNIPADAVMTLAAEHGRLIRESMQAYDAGNYARAYEIGREANAQVAQIADALAGGIVAQFPESF